MLACHPVKGACTQPLTYLGRKDVDSSAFENTREKNHKEPSKLASAHWQPVKDSSLVVKIAQGVGGRRGGRREDEPVGLFGIQSPLPVPRPEAHALGKASLRGQRPPLSCFCFVTVCWGRGRRPSIAGHKVLPVSQGPLPVARMWGGCVNE